MANGATIFIARLVAAICMTAVGLLLGMPVKRQISRDLASPEQASLGLLALMIGFTFLMALSRFDARRDTVLGESLARAFVLIPGIKERKPLGVG